MNGLMYVSNSLFSSFLRSCSVRIRIFCEVLCLYTRNVYLQFTACIFIADRMSLFYADNCHQLHAFVNLCS